MKKTLFQILSFLLLLTAVACGNQSGNKNEAPSDTAGMSAQTMQTDTARRDSSAMTPAGSDTVQSRSPD
ncbi:hypothetical protein [Sediminibacterium ginsengisoli]|uniref:Uncharacterized protein n=1 Tax=Sediminibacterium ginsengisoli TaxID=413434 RepID=A0A1T4RR95_9BACT|nr:hypothetical protein [Sediminibacterium ginsengisoli]SKA18519.1 hypothetical protein SAMN04488132_11425 [Sediminibacterium ginsengisoli]